MIPVSDIVTIAEFFFYALGVGMVCFNPLVNPKETGVGFIRLTTAIAIGALSIACILYAYQNGWNNQRLYFYVGALVASLVLYSCHGEGRSLLTWVMYGTQVTSVTLLLFTIPYSTPMELLFYFSSIITLGIVVYSMVLGHWYLVTPKLSERPLLDAVVITWAILAVKIFLTIHGSVKDIGFFQANTDLGMGYVFNWVMFTMRVLWGYLTIIVMSYFVWRLVRMRSIQSATGILYAMTFFVFAGEIISNYLHYKYGTLL